MPTLSSANNVTQTFVIAIPWMYLRRVIRRSKCSASTDTYLQHFGCLSVMNVLDMSVTRIHILFAVHDTVGCKWAGLIVTQVRTTPYCPINEFLSNEYAYTPSLPWQTCHIYVQCNITISILHHFSKRTKHFHTGEEAIPHVLMHITTSIHTSTPPSGPITLPHKREEATPQHTHARHNIHSHTSTPPSYPITAHEQRVNSEIHGGGWWRLDVFVVRGGVYVRDTCIYVIWNSMITLMVFTTIFGKPRIHQSHSRTTQGEFKECLRFAWGVFFVCFSALYNTIAV